MEEITRLRLGYANAWLLRQDGVYCLVDSGMPRLAGRLLSLLEELGVNRGNLRLAVATHGHFDHAGGLTAVSRALGCPLLAHRGEAREMAQGRWLLPLGTFPPSRAAIALARRIPRLLARATRFEPVEPDHVVDRETSLAPFGLDARVIPTPGHSPGSLTLLTAQGNAFVGDLAYNELPSLFKNRRPPFATDLDLLHQSWRTALSAGARTIHPGHGAAFDASELGG